MSESRTPSRGFATILIGGLLLAALASTANAGSEAFPEILDDTGDVQPAAVLAQLPKNATLVEHAELYDLYKVYVAGEDTDSFFLRIKVADLPDDWVLPAGTPGAPPTPSAQLDEQEIRWDESQLNSKVNLTAFFTIKGRAYQVVASLAEVNLQNPNHFPAADSKAILDEKLAALRALIEEQLEDAEALVLPIAGAVDPNAELQDNLTTAHAQVGVLQAEYNELQDPWGVLNETRRDTDAAFEFARWAINNSKARVDQYVPAGLLKDEIAKRFDEIRAKLDEAQSVADGLPAAQVEGAGGLTAPDPKLPKVILFSRFTLVDAMGRSTPLPGLVDVEQDFVQVRILKASVGSPLNAELLTRFRAESAFRGLRMDFAPDAINPAPTDAPQSLVADAASGRLVKPAYGGDYRFQYPVSHAPTTTSTSPTTGSTSPASPAPGASLVLELVGPQAQSIAAGSVATYYLRIHNGGTSSLSGFFALSAPSRGWTHELSESSWSLSSGEQAMVTLMVSALPDAAATQLSRVIVSISGGEARHMDYTTSLVEPEPSATAPPDEGAGSGSKDTPGPGAMLVVAAVAALAIVLRRRT